MQKSSFQYSKVDRGKGVFTLGSSGHLPHPIQMNVGLFILMLDFSIDITIDKV